MQTNQRGAMLIADITGYTQYLSASELDHAREVLKILLGLLIEHTRPPLILSKLAGDAVISYGLQGQLPSGQTFVELIENTYVAFRRAIDLMVLNTTCTCNACRNIGGLDLKFFVHHGEFGIDRLGERDEMVGADVIVLHRMLKNHVTERTGLRAYTLFSDAAVRALGIESFREQWIPHEEAYEHLGTVSLWIQDVQAVWRAKKDSLKLAIPPGQVLFSFETDLPVPRELAWDYVTQAAFRSMLTGANLTEIRNQRAGRTDLGSTYRCYHGGSVYSNQVVLEWQPFDYYTTENQMPIPGTSFLLRIELEQVEGGTRVRTSFGKTRGPVILKSISDRISRKMLIGLQEGMRTLLRKHLETALATGAVILPPPVIVPEEQILIEAQASLAGEGGLPV